jgi:hypothetical protein
MGYILCADREEAVKIREILSTRLYRFIANITRWSNFNVPLVMQSLPSYPLNKKVDDDSVIKFFDLSPREVEALDLLRQPKEISASNYLRLPSFAE